MDKENTNLENLENGLELIKETEEPVTGDQNEDMPEFWEEGLNESIAKAASKKKKGGAGSVIKEALTIIIAALVIAFVLKTFIIDTRLVPTLSMYPTVDANDRLIINKLAFVGSSNPERGDIVIFRPPDELHSKDDLLKRVIGLPGDTLEINAGYVYINGEPLTEEYLAAKPNYQYGPVEVPEDHYFMMGDNRNLSIDSHAWNDPFVPDEDIYGKAVACYWPLDRIGKLE